MRRQVRTYSDWQQGSAAAAYSDQVEYNSVNAQVYESGTLGPRPGWKEQTTSGSPSPDHAPGSDTLRGLTWFRQTDDDAFAAIIFRDVDAADFKYQSINASYGWNNAVSLTFLSDPASLDPPEWDDSANIPAWNDGFNLTALGPHLAVASDVSIGTLRTPIPAVTHITAGTSTTVFTVNSTDALSVGSVIDIYNSAGTLQDNAFTISDITGKTVTVSSALSGTPSSGDLILIDGTSLHEDGYPTTVTIYRERAYYWGYNNTPGRIYYSNPADFRHVELTSFFDINIDSSEAVGAVTGMWSVKNTLLIARKDDRWFALTGPSPENGTLRELGRDMVPDFTAAAVVDNEVYFLARTGQGVGVARPGAVDTKSLKYLSPTAYPDSTSVRPDNSFLPQPAVSDEVGGNLFLPGRFSGGSTTDMLAVERVNGTFNLSKWTHSPVPQQFQFSGGRPGELICVVQKVADWPYFTRNYTLNRPANSGDSLSVSLNNEDGTASGSEVIVDLGEIAAGDGKIIRPVKVILDFDYWKGGNYSAPELAVDSTIHGTEATTSEDVLATQTITTSGWANTSGDAPYHRRVAVALPQGQFGTRLSVRITYDNLALDTVQVYYDEQDDPR